MESSDALYSEERPKRTDVTLTAIPYYAWANRGENQMRVWMPKRLIRDLFYSIKDSVFLHEIPDIRVLAV